MRIVKLLFAVLAILGFVDVSLANAVTLQKGVHYDLIEPAQPTDIAGKIEVIEFFSYGCPHCYHLEPAINPWIKKLPKDVNFFRIPLTGGQWAASAKLFYALDVLGVEDKLHSDVFASIHGDKSLTGTDEAAMGPWAAKKGLDQKKFSDIFNSFAVNTKVQRAAQMAGSHKVTGVPAIVVDGRYLVLGNTVKSYDELLDLAEQVIEMARANKK